MRDRLTRTEAVARTAAVVALSGTALTHLLDLPHKVDEAPYLAVLFGALIASCAVLAVAFVLAPSRLGPPLWGASAALALGAIAGYVVSRSVGLPQIEDHVGDWVSAVGVGALVSEAVLVGLAAFATRARTRPATARTRRRAVARGQLTTLCLALGSLALLAPAAIAHDDEQEEREKERQRSAQTAPRVKATPGSAAAVATVVEAGEEEMEMQGSEAFELPGWAVTLSVAVAFVGSGGAAASLWRRTA